MNVYAVSANDIGRQRLEVLLEEDFVWKGGTIMFPSKSVFKYTSTSAGLESQSNSLEISESK